MPTQPLMAKKSESILQLTKPPLGTALATKVKNLVSAILNAKRRPRWILKEFP
jgi:hypothetical protein